MACEGGARRRDGRGACEVARGGEIGVGFERVSRGGEMGFGLAAAARGGESFIKMRHQGNPPGETFHGAHIFHRGECMRGV